MLRLHKGLTQVSCIFFFFSGRGGTALAPNQSNVSDYNRTSGNNDLLMTPPRGGHMHPDRNNFNGKLKHWILTDCHGVLNVYSLTGTHDALTPRNSGERNTGMNIPQRPSNLALESPRKHIIETKTDYGKYRWVVDELVRLTFFWYQKVITFW